MARTGSVRARSCRALADGYFVLPYTVPDYIAPIRWGVSVSHPAFAAAEADVKDGSARSSRKRKRAPIPFTRAGPDRLDECGMARSGRGPEKGWGDSPGSARVLARPRVVGGMDELNQSLEKANRVSDFLSLPS